ncbi:hypothetical protein AHAS_Ahas02G0157700 [Arachis hypogaea]
MVEKQTRKDELEATERRKAKLETETKMASHGRTKMAASTQTKEARRQCAGMMLQRYQLKCRNDVTQMKATDQTAQKLADTEDPATRQLSYSVSDRE